MPEVLVHIVLRPPSSSHGNMHAHPLEEWCSRHQVCFSAIVLTSATLLVGCGRTVACEHSVSLSV